MQTNKNNEQKAGSPTKPNSNPIPTKAPTTFSKEVEVDEWVREKLKGLGLKLGRDFFEKNASDYLKASLKGASKTKKQTGTGIPDFVIEKYQVENCTIPVIFECKLGVKYLEKYAKDNEKTLDFSNDAISRYALNGALHYARVALQNESQKQDHYKEILAIGIAADSEQNVGIKIACVFADSSLAYKEIKRTNLDFLENAKSFTHFYEQECALTEEDKHLILIRGKLHLSHHSAQLNKLMHNHNITAPQRVLYIAGMILSMQSVMSSEYRILTKGLSPADLQGLQDEGVRDGELVFARIEEFLKVKVPDGIKRKLMLDSFNEIRKDSDRDKIPKNFTYKEGEKKNPNHKIIAHILKEPSSINKQIFAYIYTHIYKEIDGLNGHLDIMGECYSEFLKYALGDGKELGIVLTPPYVTKMMAQILEITQEDRVMDLATGSAGFLISSMELMIEDVYKKHSKHSTHANKAILELKTKQLLGIEYNAEMFALATANMILRGDGSSKIYKANTFETEDKLYESFLPTRILLNPPFTWDYNGLPFIEFGLDRMQRHGLGAIIIQDSAGNGQATPITKSILSKHSLKASIKMPLDLFQPMAGVQTSIYIFEAQIPHDFDKPVKFIDFRNDGYKRTKRSLQELDSPLQRYEDILKIYKQGLNAKIDNTRYENPINLEEVYVEDFISTEGNDWNFDQHRKIDTTPTLEDFKKCVSEYLAWEVSNVLKNSTQGAKGGTEGNALSPRLRELEKNFKQNGGEWKSFKIGELFEVGTGSLLVSQDLKQGSIPRISAKSDNNGILGYFDTESNGEARHCENFISVNFFGDTFYHPYKASLEMKVHTLKLKNGIFTKSSGLFIAGIIKKVFYGKFTYGNQLSSSKLKNENFYILLPVLPTQANSVRHCEALQKPKQSTQNDEQIDCHEKSSDFSRNDENIKSQTLQDSKICDEKSGLYEVGQGSYLHGNDRRHTEAIADLSRKAKSHALAFDYMESYIKELEAERIQELEAERIQELEAYLKVTGLNDYTLTEQEQAALKAFENLSTANERERERVSGTPVPLEWREFTIGELFQISTKTQLHSKADIANNGTIPLYSSDSLNGGIVGYCNTTPTFRVDENNPYYVIFGDHTRAINIAKTDFCITDNVKVLKPKYHNISILLYIFAVWKKCIPNLGYSRHWSVAKKSLISLPVLPTHANSIRHCEAFKPKQSTQNDEQIDCHEKSNDFSRNDKNTKSHTLQDSKICDEKSGLYEVGQGSYLPGNDRRHTEAIADLSRKAESHVLAFDLPCLLPVLDSGRQDFGDKNGALRDEARELPKVVMTEAEAKQSPFLAQKPTPTINFDFMQALIKALEKESIKNVVLYQQRLKAAYEKVLKR